MNIKKFHLKDFPGDRIRVLFRDNAHFIDDNIQFFGSLTKLSEFLDRSQQVVRSWKTKNLFIPLSSISKIVSERSLDWSDIESNVTAYKNPNSGLVVRNPKLPIVESPELFAIIAHLMADGSVNKMGIPVYTNSNIFLIRRFQALIEHVFGKIDGKIYLSNSNCYQIRSSRVIIDLIKSFYQIDFGSLSSKIPSKLNKLPSRFVVAFIRAYADDEAAVDLNHRITLYSGNKIMLQDIRRLLINNLKFENVTEVLTKSKKYYYLTVKPQDLHKFYDRIGFTHPKKLSRLKRIIRTRELRSSRPRRKDINKDILDSLCKGDCSSEQLIFELGLCAGNVQIPLKRLREKGLIRKIHKAGENPIWSITEV